MTKKRLFKILLILAAIMFVAYTPLRTFKQNGTKSAFSYFAQDAFYYMNIAEKSAGKSFFSYDGEHATNGFHPLWQLIVSTAHYFCYDKTSFLLCIFIVNIIITIIAYVLLSNTISKHLKNKVNVFISLFPGYFFLLFSFVPGIEGAPWFWVNGMESGLSLLSLSLLLILVLNFKIQRIDSIISYLVISLAIILMGFSRLDDFFILPAFITTFYAFNKKGRLRQSIAISILPFMSLIIYLSYNYFTTGLVLPVSGISKHGPSLFNFVQIINILTAGVSIRDLYGVNLAIRVLPLIIPLLIATYEVIKINKNEINIYDFRQKTIFTLSSFVIMKALYNLIFVEFWHHGTWYFADNIIIANIILAFEIDKFEFPKVKKFIAIPAIIAYSMVMLNVQTDIKQFPAKNDNAFLFSDRHRIDSLLTASYNGKGLIEFDDGIVAFSLSYPCISGFGLCIDSEALHASRSGNMLDLAYARGYRALASLNYFYYPKQIPDTITSIRDFGRKPFFALDRQNTAKWRFEVIMKDTTTNFVVIGFKPR